MNNDKKKVFIRSFGWPMGAVLYDYRAVFGEDLVKYAGKLSARKLKEVADRFVK